MKALLLEQFGDLEHFRVGEVAVPGVGEEEVLVRVVATALNPVDYKVAINRKDIPVPHILGLDIAGTITQIGKSVVGFEVGEHVAYHSNLRKWGGLAEYHITTYHVLAKIPEGVSFEEAAAVQCAGMTAYQALYRKITLHPNDNILVHAGAGGVGLFGIQLAKHSGATVITTASHRSFQFVKDLGADHVIDYQQEGVRERVMQLTQGRGVNVILDTVSSQSATEGLGYLAFGGHLLCVAGLPNFAVIEPFKKAPSIHEIALGAAYGSGDLEALIDLGRMSQELLNLVRMKKLQPKITQTIPLQQVPLALKELLTRHVTGKIIVKLS